MHLTLDKSFLASSAGWCVPDSDSLWQSEESGNICNFLSHLMLSVLSEIIDQLKDCKRRAGMTNGSRFWI